MQRKKKEPNSVSPNNAAILGALGGGLGGGLIGAGAGGVGYERGIQDQGGQNNELLRQMTEVYRNA
ncbi:hypothetical protein CCP3SC5AM1_1260001 [Gammaproteobacteria bacterium]